MITVACVWVKANVAYTPDYVVKLRSMVQRRMSSETEWQFVCFTDRPADLPRDIKTVHVRPPGQLPGWWSKIELFNPTHSVVRGRVVYLDLDSIVMQSVEVVAEVCSPRAFVPHAGTWKGRDGLKVVPRYNTSVMVWDAGDEKLADIYSKWTPNFARSLWGDQDYVGLMLPNEATMIPEWFPRVSDVDADPKVLSRAVVVLCKKPKNHEAVFTRPWVQENWR